MRRRESFALWAAAIAVAGRAHAQGAQDSRSIAILSGFSKAGTAPVIDGLRRELSKLGWGDDQHIVLLEPRAVGGQYERLPALAAEIVTLNPSMVVVISVPATLAMKQATSTIPIIMMAVGDPVKYGLVASLARPGGNITGSGYFVNEVGPKLLQILHEAVPQLSQVAILGNSKNQGNAGYVQALETAGSSLGIKMHNVPLEGIEHLERALETIRRKGAGGIIPAPDPLIFSVLPRVKEFAISNKVPVAVHGPIRLLGPGVLIAGEPPEEERFHVTAVYADKILKGASPADLPIWQPVSFEFGLNLGVAASLGLTMPPALIALADRVIE